MKNRFNLFTNKLNLIFEAAELNKMAEMLLSNSDRFLEDAGLSRDKLELGADAYPWTSDKVNTWEAQLQPAHVEDFKAVYKPNDGVAA